MKLKNILLALTVIFVLITIFLYIEPSITGFVIQDKFLISDVSVSADRFDQEIKVEQFDDYEVKFDDALYYFTLEPEYEQEINYILIEFMVDSSQIRDYSKEDISLYHYKDRWLKLDTEFIKQDGRFYYYKSKSEKFGLFVVAPIKEEKIFIPLVNKGDLILFALIPIFVIILLLSSFSYSFVRITQRINYRFYLLLKKLIIGLVKFGLSFCIVVMILSLLSPEYGNVSKVSLIYYAVVPLVLFSLFTDVILNLVLWVRRLIFGNKVYRTLRNSFWLFVFVLISMLGLLNNFVPGIEGSVTNIELILYGLVPLIVISFSAVFVFYFIYVLVRKAVVRA